jgi:hypothetical protein
MAAIIKAIDDGIGINFSRPVVQAVTGEPLIDDTRADGRSAKQESFYK